MNEYELRKRGREDLIRVQADQARKEGKIPDMRKIEQDSHARADRADNKRDIKRGA